jgi:putative ABC transport system permease protein
MTGLFQDVKFALRMMAQSPWFTFVAVLTLALGIGVNSVGFSIANGVWWKKLPFEEPGEIVSIGMSDGRRPPDEASLSFPEFADIRSGVRSFKSLAALGEVSFALSNEGNVSERYSGLQVTSNMFSFLGVQPVRGRDFNPEDEKPGAPKVLLIAHDLWQSRYGGSEDVVGRAVRVDGTPATIVGVMPAGFRFLFGQRVWAPLVPSAAQRADYGNRSLVVFGRFDAGVRIQEARLEANAIAEAIAREHPDTNKGYNAVVLPFMNWVNGPEQNSSVYLLVVAVAFVLLIACGNVANLLLSRAVQRSREISVRTALGASRWRIIRQVLVESVMLSSLGGLLGLFFAQAGVRWFVYLMATAGDKLGMPFWMTFEMDYRVFAYFAFICIATGIGFGLVPALQVSKANVNDNLKERAIQTMGGFRGRRTATVLLVGEIAMTVVLLLGAGLAIRSFLILNSVYVGVDTRNLVDAWLDLRGNKYAKDSDRIAFVENFLATFNRPDRPATVAFAGPLTGPLFNRLQLQDRDIKDTSGKLPGVGVLPVANGYFAALDVPLIRGRNFQDRDGNPGSQVAIVNERFAAAYWPAENPVGKRLRLGDERAPWLDVVGVSGDILQSENNLAAGPQPVVYVPYRQNPVYSFSILVRGAGVGSTAVQLRKAIAAMDPDLALYHVTPTDEMLRNVFWTERIFGNLFTLFAVMALVMSSIGLYGVTAHGVNQRTREIGIRAALGATPFGVIWLVVKQSLKRIAAGLAIGLLGAVLLNDFLKQIPFAGIKPGDPVTFISTLVLLAAVTLAASFLPAWRASKLNPSDALRSE